MVKKIWYANIKLQMICLLLLFAVSGIVEFGIRSILPQLAIAFVTAVFIDCLISFLKKKRLFFSTSATISGLIVADVLPPHTEWYIIIFASAAAILSKHIIKIGRHHFFNPAGFGLLLSLFIFDTYLYWWGGQLTWLVIILGGLLAIRFKRLQLVVSFYAAQLFVLGAIFLAEGRALENLFLMANMFFIFVMLVEPRTSPVRKKGRIVFGIFTGILFAVFMQVIPGYAPSISALLIANITVPLINRLTKPKKSS